MDESSLLIKVWENEFKPLLDSDKIVVEIRKHLGPWADLLRDLTNYGTNVIPRCFSSSDKGMKDVVVIAILLRQVVAMLDGVEILLSRGAVHIAHLQMRALFEASIYIEWILQGDSENKASYYYVHNLRRKRLWSSRMQPGSLEAQEYVTMMNKAGVPITDQVKESAKNQTQEIDRILSQPRFAIISNNIESYRKGKRFDPPWYVPLGERSLATMARKLGKVAEYVFVYSGASEVMHTSSYEHHVKFSGKRITFQPIRSVEGFEHVFRFSSTIALSLYRRILEEYRPGELPAFSRKYLEKWQKEFLSVPKIKVNVETVGI